MPSKDGFAAGHPLPLFLSKQPVQPWIGKARNRPAISSRILMTGILVVTAAAIDFAILSVGDPVALFANVTASIQSTVGLQGLPPTATDAPSRDEIAAVVRTAGQSQTEIRQPTTEASLQEFKTWTVAEEAGAQTAAPADALLKQFQAWAAEEDARARVEPLRPVEPAQDAPAPAAQNDREQVQPAPKHRQVRPARAEIRPVQNPRAKARRKQQNARVQIPPAQDARAQDGTGQNAQAPSFLQSLGLRN
jgi:hypothetical protein